jgi:flagellar capping protein FliD
MEQGRTKWNDDRLDHLSGQVDSLRHHMDERFERQEARIDAKFATLDSRFTALDSKFDALQRTMILTLGGIIASILATFGGVLLAAQL